MRLLLSSALVAASCCFFVACPKGDGTTSPTSAASSADIFAKVQQQLGARLQAVHDFELAATMVAADGETLRYRYAMQQPAFAAVETFDAAGTRERAFIFDGKVLASIDDVAKTITRTDLSTNEEQLLLTLHQVFSPFVIEGWRPPLLRPTGTQAAVVGDTVELSVPINSAGLLRSVVTLDRSGAFVGKKTVADGEVVVAGATVTKSETDAATGLRFPTAWQQLEGGTVALTTTVTSWSVNQGIAAPRFSTAVPTGFVEAAAVAAP